MVKRCVIQPPVIRVSKPGIDVDFAGERDCLLHENKLFAQPYFQTVVSKPGGSDTASVGIPNVTSNPLVFIFPVLDGDRSVFPFPRSQSGGSNQSGWPDLLGFNIAYRVISATQIDVRFFTRSNTANILSCYLVLLRRPD